MKYLRKRNQNQSFFFFTLVPSIFFSHNAVPFFGKVTAKNAMNQIMKYKVVSKSGVKKQKLRNKLISLNF